MEKNEKSTPSFYTITPATVRYNKRLTSSEKLMYGEITAFINMSGECWASNAYFARLYDVTVTTIQRWLRALENEGFIKREVIYKDGTKMIERRYIRISDPVSPKVVTNMTPPPPHICSHPHHINDQESTTRVSTTRVNKIHAQFNEFWDHYPRKIAQAKALESFNKQVKGQETLDMILKDLENRKGFEGWQEERYIPYPATYLNQQRWNDQYETKKVDKHDYQGMEPKEVDTPTEKEYTEEEEQAIRERLQKFANR